MAKFCKVYDSLEDLKKFFFCLSLLIDVDTSTLTRSQFNSWLGSLDYTRDLLGQMIDEVELHLDNLHRDDSDAESDCPSGVATGS